VNQCRTAAARGRRREHAFPDVDLAALDVTAPHAAEEHALGDRLERALARLPAEQREAVLLKYGEELSYEDMAAATGAGVSALKMRVKRAFARLRELLQEACCV